MRAHRIFIGLHDVAGYGTSLKTGLERCGCRVRLVDLENHPFGYSRSKPGWIGRVVRWWARQALGVDRGWLRRLPARCQDWVGHLVVLLAALTHDGFIFCFGMTFADCLGTSGIFWLKRLRRRVAVVFLGSDSRPPWADRPGYFMGDRTADIDELLRLMKSRSELVDRAHGLGGMVVDNAASAAFHPAPFVSFHAMGFPTVLPDVEEPPMPRGATLDRPVRILHCPSQTGIKGTPAIRQAVAAAQAAGWNIDFQELRGVPNATVLAALQECDFVIDQIFSDTPMAGFAREAAMFGKPAIVGGYAWSDLRQVVPASEWAPSELCHPDNLSRCLAEFLQKGPVFWSDLGRRARDFVRSQWSAEACGKRWVRWMENGPDPGMTVDPQAVSYLWGAGMHALETWETLRLIRRTVGMGGFAGVQSDAMRDLIGVLTAEGGSASCPAELPLSGELKSEEWSEVAALIDGNIGAALAHRDRKLHTLARLDELRARIPLLDERIQHLEQRLSRPRAAKKKA